VHGLRRDWIGHVSFDRFPRVFFFVPLQDTLGGYGDVDEFLVGLGLIGVDAEGVGDHGDAKLLEEFRILVELLHGQTAFVHPGQDAEGLHGRRLDIAAGSRHVLGHQVTKVVGCGLTQVAE